jgi:hypothetical protein
MLKWPDERGTEGFGTQATYARRRSALVWWSLQATVPADRVLSESGSELCRIGLGSWLEVAATKLIVATVGVATVTACLDEAVRLKTWLVRHSGFDNRES